MAFTQLRKVPSSSAFENKLTSSFQFCPVECFENHNLRKYEALNNCKMKESQTSVSFPLLGFPDFPMTLPIHNSSVIQVKCQNPMMRHGPALRKGGQGARPGTSLERGECVCALEAANLRVLQIRFVGKIASAARVLSDLVPLLPSFAMDYVFEPERIP